MASPVPLRARLALAVALGVLGLAATPGTASAQLVLKGFLLNHHTPATPGSDWFVLESLDFRGKVRPALRLGFDWAHKPFVLEDATGEEVGTVLDRQIYLHAGVSLVLLDRLRLAVDLPFSIDQPGEPAEVSGVSYPDPTDPYIGDLRATADIRLVGEYGQPFTLAIGAHVFFPTGKQERYTSDGIVRVRPRVLAAGQVGLFNWAAELAFNSRDEIDDRLFQGTGIGQELYGAVAAGIKPIPELLIGAELWGASDLQHDDFLENRATAAELLFGARVNILDQIRIAVGAGPGLTSGIGTPAMRMLARLEWMAPLPPPDRDNDGVPDKEDACPDTAGVRTGDPQTNGCPPPPPDRDRDGVVDGEDACPDDPGVRTADAATNGCPPPRDRDGDGVFDPADACPDEAGEKTEDPKTNGCPRPDRDKDGVFDAEDACPDKAGEKTDDPKTSGCPDTDMDGIRDPEDACPEQAGARDADPKKSGCPLARVERGQVRITEQVKFKTGSATILPDSNTLLEAVAKVLKEHPEIKKVRVEGHTDNRGGKAMNKRLSTRRAAAVVKWLTTKGGVEKARLTSQGFGMDRPIADNSSEDGRRENRRVEFHITDPAPDAAPAPATP